MSYASVWRFCWSVVLALGVGLGILEWSALVTVAAVATLSVCAAAGLFLLQKAPYRSTLGVVDQPMPAIRSQALCIGSGFVAFSAVMSASSYLACLIGLTATLTSPRLLRSARRRMHGGSSVPDAVTTPGARVRTTVLSHPSGRAEAEAEVERIAQALRELDDTDLCCLWRHTFWELRGRHSPDDVLQLVALRACCLDELDRRNPSALQAWLSSGARASGGPERFWYGDSRRGDAEAQ
jgi:hypothetical protein